jgi:hypothetical protein
VLHSTFDYRKIEVNRLRERELQDDLGMRVAALCLNATDSVSIGARVMPGMDRPSELTLGLTALVDEVGGITHRGMRLNVIASVYKRLIGHRELNPHIPASEWRLNI